MDKNLGKRFGRLLVIKESACSINGKKKYQCLCDCGKETIVFSENLISGHTRSCGCLKNDVIHAGANTKHGLCRTRIYRIWKEMRRRCNNPNRPNYPRYGGRGIKVCDEWNSDFMSFYKWAINNKYDDSLSIDRIDNNEGYGPENCRWASPQEQSNNRRSNRFLQHNGEEHTIAEWSRITGLEQSLIIGRLRLGWSVKKALSQ